MGLDRGIGERDAIWWVGGEVRRDRFCIEGRRGLNGGRETRRGIWDDWEKESVINCRRSADIQALTRID